MGNFKDEANQIIENESIEINLLKQENAYLSSRLRQLQNELDIVHLENENISKKYLEVVNDLEKSVFLKNKQLQKTQQVTKEWYYIINLMLDNAPGLLYYKSTDLKYLQVNHKFLSFFNLSPSSIIGKTNADLINNVQLFNERSDEAVINRRVPSQNEIEMLKINGEKYYFSLCRIPIIDSKNNLLGVACLALDVTAKIAFEEEKRALEEQLCQSQKNESLGALASGIAHDFNNILSSIIGYTEMASTIELCEETRKKYIEEVLKAGLRAKELTKQILTFSRKKTINQEAIDLIDVIEDVKKLLRPILPSSIELELIKSIDKAVTFADYTQIHQVFMNICTNAYQAIGKLKGKITISFNKEIIQDNNSHGLAQGSYIRIDISDTGEGIEPEKLKEIFEPYYTSKNQNEGTGLGLSVVKKIINSYKGHIRVASEKNKGTTFTLLLPQIDSYNQQTENSKYGYLRGSQSILFVDDEQSVTSLIKDFLSYIGYNVVTCCDSTEALKIFEKDPTFFHAVISDMIMPNLTGIELIEKIRILNPDIPTILASGFYDQSYQDLFPDNKNLKIIKKPYELNNLSLLLYDLFTNDE
ncbi:MAG TPA: ATP-binding protein [Candidatus Cloacimonadota bacterium]|nr:ATP-binding protein [Candidatus Cloacimonadota bacterium]